MNKKLIELHEAYNKHEVESCHEDGWVGICKTCGAVIDMTRHKILDKYHIFATEYSRTKVGRRPEEGDLVLHGAYIDTRRQRRKIARWLKYINWAPYIEWQMDVWIKTRNGAPSDLHY